jgi:hypothetical protein
MVACTFLALMGCASMSKVVRAGPDTYMVSAGGGMYEQNPSGIRQEVYEAANRYCDGMAKRMASVQVNERPYELGAHTASIELIFKCQ